jgi:NAD(P)-dependent dehydrogenase (short-subunit alcohol dehydrogenase family)
MKSEWSARGKNILVTGSSRGIGFHTARGLALGGAHVIIVSHNREHCEEAVRMINQEVNDDIARYYVANLASKEEIKRFSEQVKNDYDHLDVLINNVGGWYPDFQESPDGIEMTFALNHLSYFLVTGLLLTLLRQTKSSRIINVSSDAHYQADGIQFEDVEYKKKYKAFQAYSQSKLANIMFTYSLVSRLNGTGITANALHPGFVNSDLYRNYGPLTPIIKLFAKIAGKSPEEGAETPIFLARSPEVAGVSGKYFEEKGQKRSSDASYDKSAWKKLWEISEELTGFTYSV